MKKTKEDDVLWTIKDVARYFRLSIKTIYIMVSKEAIPVVKIGRNLRFKPSKIRELTEERSRHENVMHKSSDARKTDNNQGVAIKIL